MGVSATSRQYVYLFCKMQYWYHIDMLDDLCASQLVVFYMETEAMHGKNNPK